MAGQPSPLVKPGTRPPELSRPRRQIFCAALLQELRQPVRSGAWLAVFDAEAGAGGFQYADALAALWRECRVRTLIAEAV